MCVVGLARATGKHDGWSAPCARSWRISVVRVEREGLSKKVRAAAGDPPGGRFRRLVTPAAGRPTWTRRAGGGADQLALPAAHCGAGLFGHRTGQVPAGGEPILPW